MAVLYRLNCPSCGRWCRYVREFQMPGTWELVIKVDCGQCGEGLIY